jgi:hypothetical protein
MDTCQQASIKLYGLYSLCFFSRLYVLLGPLQLIINVKFVSLLCNFCQRFAFFTRHRVLVVLATERYTRAMIFFLLWWTVWPERNWVISISRSRRTTDSDVLLNFLMWSYLSWLRFPISESLLPTEGLVVTLKWGWCVLRDMIKPT